MPHRTPQTTLDWFIEQKQRIVRMGGGEGRIGDDVFQNGIVKILRGILEARSPRSMAGIVAKSACRDTRRRENRWSCGQIPSKFDMQSMDGDPASEVERREVQAAVTVALATLPPELREVVEAKRFRDETERQTADRLAIPIKAVRMKRRRAEEILRRGLATVINAEFN